MSAPKFRLNYMLSFIVTNNYWYCPGFGYENQKIEITIKNTLRFQNCYKKMIESICDRSGAWTGITAKYFQTCSNSNFVDVPIYNLAYKRAALD